MLSLATARIAKNGYADSFRSISSSFADALSSNELTGKYDGILFDLGVSSLQLDTPSRGFSYRSSGPLDMRMDKSLAVTAADLVNGLGRKELIDLFEELGQDRYSKQIVGAILRERKLKPIKTTDQLVKVIESVVPNASTSKLHPATRVFQALRMAVNSERDELKAALPSALSWLSEGGVLAVISFHSLEHEIVDKFFEEQEAAGTLSSLTKEPLTPTPAEINTNHRARSARLRVARKI